MSLPLIFENLETTPPKHAKFKCGCPLQIFPSLFIIVKRTSHIDFNEVTHAMKSLMHAILESQDNIVFWQIKSLI